MALYARTPLPYQRTNPPDSEPLRNKAFSQIDNTLPNYCPSNQDKISEIKKKYEKLLNRSGNKSNEENAFTSAQFGKSVSTFQPQDENGRWGVYNKSYQTPTNNKERRNAEPYESAQGKNSNPRPYAIKEYYNPKVEVKSQLENNRITLNNMKNQLQNKLNDLSAKTTTSSILRNPATQPQKKEEIQSTYEAILNKYSKNISQNRAKSTHQKIDKSYSKYRDRPIDLPPQRIQTLETKINDTKVSTYIPKYTQSNKNNLTTIERAAKEKQLSTISEISNSNHSQNPSYEAEVKESRQKLLERYRHHQNSLKSNAESNIIIDKPLSNVSKPQNNNWFKNTASFVESKPQQPSNPQFTKQNMEFTLQKLQNTQGFSITRTVTQENFMNLNKISQIQARIQQRQRQYSALNAQTKTAEQQKKPATPPPTNYSKNNEEINTKQAQKIADQKSQILRLKEKYSISSSNKYTNPYREKRSQTTKNNKEATPAKQTKDQVKAEPRNNQVISKEIQKLDMKIKQIEQNKKDLNIKFRPYQVSKSVPKVPGPTESHQIPVSINKTDKQAQKITQASNIGLISTANNDRNKYNLRYQAYLQRVKPLYSQITLSESQKAQQSSGFAIKLMPVESNHEEDSQTDRSASKSRINDYKNKVELQNRTDNGIEERKKRLQDKVELNNNIKNLVKVFGQQAVLDQLFRNNKIWFGSERQHKWSQLKRQLSTLGINLSESELKSVFLLQQSENNPFFSISDNKCNMKTLAQSYKQAQRHWEQKIVHRFSKIELQRQGLSSSKVDCDKKGFIEIEDIVRFLNIQSGSFLRNRDVSIIFKRMAPNGSKLQFNQFIGIISE